MDRDVLRHLARLSALSLDANEEQRLAGDIGAIVAFVEQLRELDRDDESPVVRVGSTGGTELRDDVAAPGLSHDEALAGAPRAAHGGFVVPTFVE